MATIFKKREVGETVWELALARIRHAFDLFDHISVSFSGGKDSTVVLNLALMVARERGRLPLHVIHFDEEAIPFEVEAYVRRLAAHPDIHLDWYCIPIKHRNACSKEHPYWYTWAPEDEALWVRPMPPEGITHLGGYDSDTPAKRMAIPSLHGLCFPPEQYGRVGALLGIRARESMTRYRMVARRAEENYITHHAHGFDKDIILGYGNVWKVYPIYDWHTSDIWTAFAQHEWDYCAYYDSLEMVGVSHHEQRLAPPFGEQPVKSLYVYQQTSPALWDRMVYRVPGAAAAVRYSRTELYGVKGVPEKPGDVSWEEFLAGFIEEVSPENRLKVAKRIRAEIRTHLKKTGNAPILPKEPHPVTGLSWEFLLQVVMREDTKKRLDAVLESRQTTPERYALALAEYESGLSEGGTRF